MSDGANPLGAFLSLWMFLKLIGVLASLGGGIYALFCLSRITSQLSRIADAMESQAQQPAQNANLLRAPNAQSFTPTEAVAPPVFPSISPPVYVPLSTPPISSVPPENAASSTQSPSFTEHDVRPRNDSF